MDYQIVSIGVFQKRSRVKKTLVSSNEKLWRNSKRYTILILSTRAEQLTNYMKVGILGLDLNDVKNFNVPILDNVVIYSGCDFDKTVTAR